MNVKLWNLLAQADLICGRAGSCGGGVVDGVAWMKFARANRGTLAGGGRWVPLSRYGSVPRSNSAPPPASATKAREANAEPHTRILHTQRRQAEQQEQMKNSDDQQEQAKGRQDHHHHQQHHHQLHLRKRIVDGARISAKVMGAIMFCALAPVLYVVVPPAHDTGDRP